MLRQRSGRCGASHGPRFHASYSALVLLGGPGGSELHPGGGAQRRISMRNRSMVVRLQEMKHQADREEVAADVEALRAVAGVHLGAGEGPAVFDDQSERAAEPNPEAEGHVAGCRVGLVADAAARAGIDRVAEPSPAVE